MIKARKLHPRALQRWGSEHARQISRLNLSGTKGPLHGACNPKMAHQALGIEPRVGAMLPCNVILREVEGGVEVSAIDPVASMQAVDNPELKRVAGRARDMLTEVIKNA